MSKILTSNATVLASFLLILQFFTFNYAQDFEVRIRIEATATMKAEITVTLPENNKAESLWFLDRYGEESGLLTERFSRLNCYDRQGVLVARKLLSAGERIDLSDIRKLAYTVDLTPRPGQFAAAHVSWMKVDGGLVVLDDLLPQEVGSSAKISFELPLGWKLAGFEKPGVGVAVPDIGKAVFWAGSNIRGQTSGPLRLVISDEWRFSDAEATAMAASIFQEYLKDFGPPTNSNTEIRLAKFPIAVTFGNWEADTRGSSVTIISSDMPFKSPSLQRLHEQLRHELFHLWIPNGLNLSGNYDWFYEGFALYQSLKIGVDVNRLRFDDFLDSLSRAYEIDSAQKSRTSLIDASRQRWSGSNTQVYARGMLLAFICDVAMLNASGGKRSITDLIKEVISKHNTNTSRTDGNAALIAIFKSHREIAPMADRYISGTEPFPSEMARVLAGIEIEQLGQNSKFKITAKPSGKQKRLLEKLGIDNWRKRI